jgi:hypothetical protein
MFIYKLPIQINENVLDIYLPRKDYIYNGMSKIDTPSLLNYASKHQHNIIRFIQGSVQKGFETVIRLFPN